LEELKHLAGDDALDIAAAGDDLPDARRVDVELNFVPPAAAIEYIALEVRRDVESESVGPLIHAAIHLAGRDDDGRQEAGRIESAD
jgi:hypothetical protein